MSSSGQGSISHSHKNSPPGGTPPFGLNSANSGLHVDIGTGVIQLGSNGVNPLLQNTNIDLANFNFLIDNNGAWQLQINPTFAEYLFGDISGAANHSYMEIDDQASAFHFFSNGNQHLQMLCSPVQLQYNFGDLNNAGNGLQLQMTDALLLAEIGITPGPMFRLDALAGIYQIGDINAAGILNNTTLTVNDGTGNIEIRNGAGTAIVEINGTPGFSGTVVAPATITVDGGIVTHVG